MPNLIKELKKLVGNMKLKSKKAYSSGATLGQTAWASNQTNAPFNENDYIRPITDSAFSALANGGSDVVETFKEVKLEDTRVDKKPVEIFKEILTDEPVLSLDNVDDQIAIVKRRMKILRDEVGMTSLGDEERALKYLEARKKYKKAKIKFAWATTTRVLIQKLCKDYKVKEVAFESYYRNIPMEAIDELEAFIKVFEQVSDDKPLLKLIVDDGGKETKKDPILLAASPLGSWYYVLGAWDKEVEIVDDLIYNGK